MGCRLCGQHLPVQASFCPRCGTAVHEGPAFAQTPTERSGWTEPPAAPTGWEDTLYRPSPAATVPTPVPPPAARRPAVWAIAAGAGVLALVAGLGAAWLVVRPLWATVGQPEPTRSAGPVPTASVAPTRPGGRSTGPVVSDEDAALTTLRSRAAGNARALTFEGQWVAQLASKYVGIRDPLQTAANGTHTFQATDIIAESDALAARVGGAKVVLLSSLDYGKRFHHNGDPLWVTMALSPSFTSRDAVVAWCAEQFSELSGDELANQCMPNRLNP